MLMMMMMIMIMMKHIITESVDGGLIVGLY